MIEYGFFEVKATASNIKLGDEDFDRRIVDFFKACFSVVELRNEFVRKPQSST